MILFKSLNSELEIRKKLEESENRLKAVYNIKKLLSKIDYSSEELPISSAERMIFLLTSLKGESLDRSEASIVYELVEM